MMLRRGVTRELRAKHGFTRAGADYGVAGAWSLIQAARDDNGGQTPTYAQCVSAAEARYGLSLGALASGSPLTLTAADAAIANSCDDAGVVGIAWLPIVIMFLKLVIMILSAFANEWES